MDSTPKTWAPAKVCNKFLIQKTEPSMGLLNCLYCIVDRILKMNFTAVFVRPQHSVADIFGLSETGKGNTDMHERARRSVRIFYSNKL